MGIHRFQRLTRIVGICFGAFIAGCSLGPFAGGTGVGNPGGNTIVSIVADTGCSGVDKSGGAAPVCERSIPLPLDGELPIVDSDSLVFLANSIGITVQRIYFMLGDTFNGYDVLDSTDTVFTCDDEHIILDGPFIFDALTGRSTPPFNSIRLPKAKYTGMKLHIKGDSSADWYAIQIAGTFVYNDTTRNFSISMEEDVIAQFRYKGPAFAITEDDSTEFLLVLNAELWLEHISIKEYLDENLIQLNTTGDLIIDKTTDGAPYKELKRAFRTNIIQSGFLIILPVH